jgi:hypothetical protein
MIQLHDLLHNQMEFWHPVNQPAIGNYNKEEKQYHTPEGLELPDGETLSYDVTRCYDIGKERAIRYCQHNYIDNPYEVNRSEKTGVELTKILATTLDLKNECKRYIDAEISV